MPTTARQAEAESLNSSPCWEICSEEEGTVPEVLTGVTVRSRYFLMSEPLVTLFRAIGESTSHPHGHGHDGDVMC